MLWVMFLSAWVGLAVALPRSRRWWVAGPIVLVLLLGGVGVIAPLFIAVYFTPLAGIALALIAGWTRAHRPNIALGAVVATFVVAYAGLAAQTSEGRSALDAFTAFTVFLLAVTAISWVLGRAAHDLTLRARRSRSGLAPLGPAVSSGAESRRPVLPPPPRY